LTDELRAAGITDPSLQRSYRACRELNARHGKTYFLATRLLPPSKRPFVHALYGFARYADEIVDDLSSTLTPSEKRAWLEEWSNEILESLRTGRSSDGIGIALIDTVDRFQIPIGYFEAFLHSMAMDLTVTEYADFEALSEYVYGSAAVIGLQMVHVLGVQNTNDFDRALDGAKKLGIAFQLANFIRDVGEDLDRGRVYLPLDELARFGLDRAHLEKRVIDERLVDALSFQIARVRELKTEADRAIPLLRPEAMGCIRAASELYCGIVDEVEKIDYEVFTRRAKTSILRRAGVALPEWWQARKTWS
jgi:phytoene synthase